jgi:hypothetical protein
VNLMDFDALCSALEEATDRLEQAVVAAAEAEADWRHLHAAGLVQVAGGDAKYPDADTREAAAFMLTCDPDFYEQVLGRPAVTPDGEPDPRPDPLRHHLLTKAVASGLRGKCSELRSEIDAARSVNANQRTLGAP